MSTAPHAGPGLSVVELEAREVPSAGEWLVEPFQRGPSSGLPSGWTQWSSDRTAGFSVDSTGVGLGDTGRLISEGNSATSARAWISSGFGADVETSAAVFVNSLTPVQLFVRGQNLTGTQANYYAVSVTRGGEVQLIRMLNGTQTVLARVTSTEYISNRWLQLNLTAEGDTLQVRVTRGDTNQVLGSDGRWTRQPVNTLSARDTNIRTAGQVGFARSAANADTVAVDNLRVGPASEASRTSLFVDRFAYGEQPNLPANWGVFNDGRSGVTTRTAQDETLRVDGPSTAAIRVWPQRSLPDNVQITSSIYVDSLVSSGLIVRGNNLHLSSASYYAVSVKRGLQIELQSVVNGRSTTLATLQSREYVSGTWVQASITAVGSELRVQIYRSDTGAYLKSDGTWSLTPEWAISRTDTTITRGERAGLFRGTGYAGELIFDNIIITSAPPRLFRAEAIPTEQDKFTTPPIRPEDTPPPRVPPVVPPTVPTVPPVVVPPVVAPRPTTPPVVPAVPPSLPPTPTNASLPTVARNYTHIRIAQLAYHGTPFTDFENSLLRNSVDLVIPNQAFLEQINTVSPETPQFVYTNLSNIYLGLYTDWLEYADRNRISREAAFYHVNQASTFTGLSASAVPVERFWGVYRSATGATYDNVTSSARNSDRPVVFGNLGGSVAVGYPEKYREINYTLQTPSSGGWAGTYEYVTAVDSQGRPTAWAPLRTLGDTTANLRRAGQVTFDPPSNWVASSFDGSGRLFYVRLRTTSAGTAPQANTISGNDYTNFQGAARGGVTPAFDSAADRDRDGYLNDREYAARRRGFDARFEYQSRVFYPTYGPLRFATNVSNPSLQAWAADYHVRYLRTQPLADGFFVDNSVGKIAIDPATIKEPLTNYANDYGTLIGTVNRRLGPTKWVIANTAGAGTAAEPILRNGVSFLEEFALRPTTTNHVQFDDLAATLAQRRTLSQGRAFEILDSLPQGVDPNDPRVELTTLAMYYLLADPNLSFLMLNGGNEPNSSWRRHWTDAIAFDVGRPTSGFTQLAAGVDPSNRSLTYKVYQRNYQNALVLYKPVSYTRGTSGTTANNTATVHQLDGWYRPLKADGSLGTPVRQVSIRNGEGLILVKSS